jgi:hypothetical protein
MKRFGFNSACLILLLAAPPTWAAGARFALVIGNSHYGGRDDVSGIEDAKRMRDTLLQIGFKKENIVMVTDGCLKDITRELDAFGDRIDKGDAEVAFFFFSGHGFQKGTENYLMPVDGSYETDSVIPLARVKSALAYAPKAVKLVFLDACREFKDVRGDMPKGLHPEQAPSSPKTLYAFAAGPNETTPAGKPNETSSYTQALLHHLNEPGLKLSELLDRVANDSALRKTPSYVLNGIPSDFYLREPVYVRAEIPQIDGRLLVMVNGEVAANLVEPLRNQPGVQATNLLPLRSGHNDIVLFMSKSKTYHNNHDWDVPEGWSYTFRLGFNPSGEIECGGARPNGVCFTGGEEHPFKDGPHHGGLFTVARTALVVDGNSNVPIVRVEGFDQDIWKRELPLSARDQGLLFENAVAGLGIIPEDIMEALDITPPWSIILRPIVEDILHSGKLGDHQIADPENTYATVWGNNALYPAVQACMTDFKPQRMLDLKASLQAVVARKPRPFEIFDNGLTECIKSRGVDGFRGDDIRIWTAFSDRSKD